MADDQNSPNRMSSPSDRPAAAGAQGSDPLAELARLIGQNDPFSEFGRNQRHPAAAQQPPQQQSPSEQLLAAPPFGDMREQSATAAPYPSQPEPPSFIQTAQEGGPYRDAVYHDDAHMPPGGAYYDESAERGRGRGFRTITVVAVLALLGTAAAFGYRFIVGGGTPSGPPPVIRANPEPAKVPPPSSAESPAKSTYDRVGDRGQGERVVVREETPVDIKDVARPGAGRSPPPPQGPANQSNVVAPNVPPGGSGASGSVPAGGVMGEPKKVHTVTIRPNANDSGSPPTSLTPPTNLAAPPAPPTAPMRAAPSQQSAPVQLSPPAQQRTQQRAPAPPQVQQQQQSQQTPQLPPQQPQQRAPVTQSGAPPANAPLSLNEDSVPALPRSLNEPRPAPQQRQAPAQRPAPPPRSAAAPPPPPPPQALAQAPARGGGYLVQVSSQRSEADAQAALRTLQARFSGVLGGQPATVRRAELGERGVFYRAMIGPYGSREQATQLCSSLKAAGGDCIVQGN